MSEDEMIQEFMWRIPKLASRAKPNDIAPNGTFAFDGNGYSAARVTDLQEDMKVEMFVVNAWDDGTCVFLGRADGTKARIRVEDHEAEEILLLMRQDMVLDDLADV